MFEIVNTDRVIDFPTLVERYQRTPIIPPRMWRAIYADGRWSIVGDLQRKSVQLDVNPYRAVVAGDLATAHHVAGLLNSKSRTTAGLRLVLAAVQMYFEAQDQGIDASADLKEYARQARETLPTDAFTA